MSLIGDILEYLKRRVSLLPADVGASGADALRSLPPPPVGQTAQEHILWIEEQIKAGGGKQDVESMRKAMVAWISGERQAAVALMGLNESGLQSTAGEQLGVSVLAGGSDPWSVGAGVELLPPAWGDSLVLVDGILDVQLWDDGSGNNISGLAISHPNNVPGLLINYGDGLIIDSSSGYTLEVNVGQYGTPPILNGLYYNSNLLSVRLHPTTGGLVFDSGGGGVKINYGTQVVDDGAGHPVTVGFTGTLAAAIAGGKNVTNGLIQA